MISVIMPVFNTKQYLVQAIDSVLKQTYQDWELILVDDGSLDGSGKICDDYASKDRRIRVIHQENRGPSGARNTGMEYASGEFIQFLDSDDWLYPDTLEAVHDLIIASGSDMVIFDAQYEGDNFSWHEKSIIPDGVYDSEAILENLAKPSIPPYAWNKFCRRALYDDVYFPEGEKWEDVATTFYPVSKAKKIAVLGKPLYHYWQRGDAITKVTAKDGSIHKWRFIQYRKRYEFLKTNYPHLAHVAKKSVFVNGLFYYAICLREKSDQTKNREVFDYLCSREFDDGIANRKIWFAREIFKFCPAIISCYIRKRYSVRN